MAHHLAETIEEAKNAEGKERERARRRAADLILGVWARRTGFPRDAYPLARVDAVMSLVERLRAGASPFGPSHGAKTETERLLAEVFEGLRRVMTHSAILAAGVENLPHDLDDIAPHLDEKERLLLETYREWQAGFAPRDISRIRINIVDIVRPGEPQPAQTDRDDGAEAETRPRRVLIGDIEKAIEALSELKKHLEEDNGEK